MKLSHKIIMISAAALMGVGATIPATVNNLPVQAAKKKISKKAAKADQIILGHNSYVYFSNGKRNKNYKVGKKKYSVIAKGSKLSSYGVKMINDVPYYFIGNGNYIKAANIAKLNGKKVTVKDAEKAAKKVTTKSIKLTHNAYVYNRKGKRIKSAGTLKKNSVINYIGTKKIKGKNYYNLGKGQYVKTANAKVRKSNTTTTVVNRKDKDTYIRIVTNSTIYNEKAVAYPESDYTVAVRGADYKAMSAKKMGGQWYYQIGTDQYVKAANAYVIEGPGLITDPSYKEPKPVDNSANTIVTLKKTAPTYNIKGQVVNNNSFNAGQSLRVSRAVWIWVPTENQAVEFYKIASDSSSYIRVDDVDLVSGMQLTPSNTAEEARENAVVATSSDKAGLKDMLSRANSIKTSSKYKFSSKEARDEFDSAINNGNLIMASTSATIANVKVAIKALDQAESHLTGSKITVADVNNLSTTERDAVIKLAADVNGVSEDDVSLINGAQSVQINNLNGSSKVDPITDYVN